MAEPEKYRNKYKGVEDIYMSSIIKLDLNTMDPMRHFMCKPGEFHRRFTALGPYAGNNCNKIITCGDYGIRVYDEASQAII